MVIYIDLLRVNLMFGMPTGAKMSLALTEQIEIGCSSFKFKHHLRARTITRANKLLILYAK